MKAVFWLGIMALAGYYGLRFKQSRISMEIRNFEKFEALVCFKIKI